MYIPGAFFLKRDLCVQRYARQGRLKGVLCHWYFLYKSWKDEMYLSSEIFTGDNTSYVLVFHFIFVQTVILYNSV